MKGYLYLTVAIIGEIVGTNFLKATNNFHSLIPSLVCICSYCVCFYSLTLALDSIPLNIAYALWGAIGITLITATSYFIWKEPLNVPTLIGLILIILGTVLVEFYHS
ncbi:QacE family quaternary ammonium compound efflux SMR transporter [Bombilactobacillus bombi]|uniref:DMT family transporter n=1 Tax=Bombilactobacillus bombi TaxID=1303590 RepID=UPI000E582ADB|nr:multidrug efflux SMR transporter [Bombilactobacillus bombi]AXX65166.1 QacE family quaternary ammonium compound efflux SMR transporter [Bombilactobacillus bombi]